MQECVTQAAAVTTPWEKFKKLSFLALDDRVKPAADQLPPGSRDR